MSDQGILAIRIWVNWQGIVKPVTVFKRHCLRNESHKMTSEFFRANPSCAELQPEVTWTFTEHVSLGYKANK